MGSRHQKMLVFRELTMTSAGYLIRNTLLNAASESSFGSLRGALQQVNLPSGTVLIRAGEKTTHVFFIETGIASNLLRTTDGRDVEILQTGFEGLIGGHAVSAAASTPYRTVMATDGAALRLSVREFHAVVNHHRTLQQMLERYAYCRELQLAQLSVSCLSHRLNVRVARWLLMCRDRMPSGVLPFTHDFIASCLGTRRAGVTNELHILEGMHAIKASRGVIEIRDAQPIRRVAGNSYGLPEKEYRRLILPLAKASRKISVN